MLTGQRLFPFSGNKPKQLVVLLHGYGASGEDMLDLAGHWSALLPDAEFFAPNGLEPWEMSPLGYQWFGLKDFSPFNVRAGLDRVGPSLVKDLNLLLVERELMPDCLALVGFSQGCMVALEMIFRLQGLRAVLGYSGAFYPPIAQSLNPPYPEVMLIHGDRDLVVPYPALSEAKRQLGIFGLRPQAHSCYGLAHGINQNGIDRGGHFLAQAFQVSSPVIYRQAAGEL